MQEPRYMCIRSLGREDALEEEMATHCSILTWKIAWTQKPGWLQPMGSQRVRHDWAYSGTGKLKMLLSYDPATSFFRNILEKSLFPCFRRFIQECLWHCQYKTKTNKQKTPIFNISRLSKLCYLIEQLNVLI